MPAPRPTATRQCAVPGCHEMMNARRKNAVCPQHLHLDPYCTCSNCMSRRRAKKSPSAKVYREPAALTLPWETH